MAEETRFAAQLEEIDRIDYFLDQLARAVERGEVHRVSYDMLAPRYLHRRTELVAIITGTPVAQAARHQAPTANPPSGASASAVPTPFPQGRFAPAHDRGISHAPARRTATREPIGWATILLFLGAFLVIVAASIFSVAVWDILDVTGKLAFLGAVTAGFYAAGWWARTRLDLKAGSVALIVVASAMLLLDGWIAIDGYNLDGPLPWAVLLLGCSVVYWLTEVWLGDRFFGVIGAAAQMAWWWLLGQGIGMPAPARLAGMAVVALVWQLASERGEDDDTLGSLATVLGWAAPVASALLVVGVLADLALVRSAGLEEVAYAAIVAVSGAVVVHRSRHIAEPVRHWVSAALQVALLVSIWVAHASGVSDWALAAIAALATAAYGGYALLLAGLPMALVALFAEFTMVWLALRAADASDLVMIGGLGVLGAAWALTARLSDRLAEESSALPGARGLEVAAEAGAVVLLASVSLAFAIAEPFGVLSGATPRGGAFTALVLGAAWLGALFARRSAFTLAGSAASSVYAVALVVGWLAPNAPDAVLAIFLVVSTAAWLMGSRLLAGVFSAPLLDAYRWIARGFILVATLAGSSSEWNPVTGGPAATWSVCALLVVSAAVFAADALVLASIPSAAAAGGLIIAGIAVGALAAVATPFGHGASVAAALGALALGIGVVALDSRARARDRALEPEWRLDSRPAVASLAATAVATFTLLLAIDEPGWLTLALVLVAGAWAATSAFAWPLISLSGVAAVAAAASLSAQIDAGPWFTVAAISVVAALATVLATRPRRDDRPSLTGLAFAMGVLAAFACTLLASYGPQPGDGAAGWLALDGYQRAVAFFVLGGSVHMLARAFAFEAGSYLGQGVILLGVWSGLSAYGVEFAEWYTTTLALYLALVGVQVSGRGSRSYPALLDVPVALIGLGIPLAWALQAGPSGAGVHALWVVGLSVVAIAAGVVVKSRWYFFGGVTALALVAFYRSFVLLLEYWWLLLGIVGVLMLAFALTWEQQRTARGRLLATFENWR